MLSKKTEYALSALSFLATRYKQGPASSADIALHKNIPSRFLSNILVDLRKAGLVDSKKGKGGGYYFGKDPDDVTLATVIRLIDGPISLLPCVSLYFYEKCFNCDEKHCGLRDVLIQVRDANLKLLEKKTIADLSPKVKA